MPKLDAAKLWALHYAFFSSVIGGVAAEIEALGVDAKELFLLDSVEANPYPAELANACLMPKPTVTLYVKRLEAAKLLAREIDQADLRRHKLSLTPEGKRLVARGMALLTRAYGERLARLTAAEQAEFKRLLDKLA